MDNIPKCKAKTIKFLEDSQDTYIVYKEHTIKEKNL